MTSFLALARYAPQLLTFTLYISGLWHKELYLLLFGIGMSLDGALNYALNSWLSDDVLPRVATCVPVHGAVLSYETQQMAFFVTFVLGYIELYEAAARVWHLLLLVLLFAVVFVGDHLLNYHTAESIVAAATLGSLLAFVYQWLLYVALVPLFPWALRQRWMRWFGYEDTLCFTTTTSALGRYVLRAFDARFDGFKSVPARAEVCDVVRDAVFDYLTREHAIFDARNLARIEPLLTCRLTDDREPFTLARARQFIEEQF